MSTWLKNINAGSIPIKDVDSFTTNVDLIKNADSGVQNIDDALKNLNYTQVGDEIHVNEARYRDMEKKFRKGEISSALNDANVTTTVTASDEAILKTSLKKEAPDIDVQELDNKIDTAKTYHNDLDVTSTSGADLESKLSETSKEKAKSMWSKITKVVGVGGIAIGVFTAVKITNNVFDDINDAANARNGCFLVYKSTNTVSCKIPSKSCGYDGGSSTSITPCSTSQLIGTKYNIYCMVHHFVNTNDTTSIDELTALGCVWNSGATAGDVLNVTENLPILSTYYDTKYPDFNSVPFVACEIPESGYVGCIACDPTQPTNAMGFTSTETLDGNMMYKCITNTTSIEAITDIATSVGVDIFSASGDSLSGSFQGNFLMTVIIILVLIAIIAIIIRFVPKKDKNKETVSELQKSNYQEPQQNQYQQNSYQQNPYQQNSYQQNPYQAPQQYNQQITNNQPMMNNAKITNRI